jgi:hypothetical protein
MMTMARIGARILWHSVPKIALPRRNDKNIEL